MIPFARTIDAAKKYVVALASAGASVNGALKVQRQGDWSYLHAER